MSRKVRIDPLVYPLWAFLLLAVPLKFLIGWLGAVICHEMGHITAQYILGGRPGMLCIGPTGAVIEGEDLGFCKNILCVMAGPVIGAFPVLFMRSFPEFAVCAFLLTAYNLIPLYPLDGGRGLRCLMEDLFCLKNADSVCKWTEISVIIFIIGFCLWAGFIHKLGIAPVILALLTVSKARCGKISCKEGNLRVQ